ncbi:hypothetical protein Taro_037418 [Colocasia esculenta]|uniref:Uncharacterized protein n=1 Tax=Colocasia esculenta TaxID=4460 RepID=A0A843W9P7_COLES|nr:hypothetical protein [Colocasia esculenta]
MPNRLFFLVALLVVCHRYYTVMNFGNCFQQVQK